MKYIIEKVENGWVVKQEANYTYTATLGYTGSLTTYPAPISNPPTEKKWIAKDAEELYNIFKKIEFDDSLSLIKGKT